MLKLEKIYDGFSPYMVYLRHPRYGIYKGRLTAPISIQTMSEWSETADQPNNKLVAAGKALGMDSSMMTPSVSTQVWMGTQPIVISATIGRVALNSTSDEILKPTSELLGWTLPPVIESFLTPPVNPQRGDLCSLMTPWLVIPNFLVPREVAIDLDPTLDMYEWGPIKHSVTLTFITYRLVSAAEIKSWFMV